ncbi:MAG: hypothetical protein H0U96_05435 [Acidobacteria bacterium]|nr:hypothetical protein [Acidobacteriota bacterium]
MLKKSLLKIRFGITVIKETRPIFLDEDVQAYFPDTQSVNQALRVLIALVPEKNSSIERKYI